MKNTPKFLPLAYIGLAYIYFLHVYRRPGITFENVVLVVAAIAFLALAGYVWRQRRNEE